MWIMTKEKRLVKLGIAVAINEYTINKQVEAYYDIITYYTADYKDCSILETLDTKEEAENLIGEIARNIDKNEKVMLL